MQNFVYNKKYLEVCQYFFRFICGGKVKIRFRRFNKAKEFVKKIIFYENFSCIFVKMCYSPF